MEYLPIIGLEGITNNICFIDENDNIVYYYSDERKFVSKKHECRIIGCSHFNYSVYFLSFIDEKKHVYICHFFNNEIKIEQICKLSNIERLISCNYSNYLITSENEVRFINYHNMNRPELVRTNSNIDYINSKIVSSSYFLVDNGNKLIDPFNNSEKYDYYSNYTSKMIIENIIISLLPHPKLPNKFNGIMMSWTCSNSDSIMIINGDIQKYDINNISNCSTTTNIILESSSKIFIYRRLSPYGKHFNYSEPLIIDKPDNMDYYIFHNFKLIILANDTIFVYTILPNNEIKEIIPIPLKDHYPKAMIKKSGQKSARTNYNVIQ